MLSWWHPLHNIILSLLALLYNQHRFYCNQILKKRRKEVENIVNNAKNVRNGAMLVNETPYDRVVREIVREIDAYESSVDPIARNFKDN